MILVVDYQNHRLKFKKFLSTFITKYQDKCTILKEEVPSKIEWGKIFLRSDLGEVIIIIPPTNQSFGNFINYCENTQTFNMEIVFFLTSKYSDLTFDYSKYSFTIWNSTFTHYITFFNFIELSNFLDEYYRYKNSKETFIRGFTNNEKEQANLFTDNIVELVQENDTKRYYLTINTITKKYLSKILEILYKELEEESYLIDKVATFMLTNQKEILKNIKEDKCLTLSGNSFKEIWLKVIFIYFKWFNYC